MAVKPSQSGARVLVVLEAIASNQPIGVRAIAKLLDCDKSAVQRAIMTLAEQGWVRHTSEPPPRWELTARILSVAEQAQGGNDLRRRVRRTLESLRDETGETAMLVVPDAGHFVVADVAESRQMLRMAPHVGIIVTPRDTATGRAILPFLAESRREGVLGETPDIQLSRSYGHTRRRGFAISEGEINPGAVSVAAPIFETDGQPTGALVITGPRDRMAKADRERIGETVARHARDVSRSWPIGDGVD